MTARVIIRLVVEATEIAQHAEAPISISILAFFEEFQVIITRRMGEQSILTQIPEVVALIRKLQEEGFKPVKTNQLPALPNAETKETGKEIVAPICSVHNVSLVQRQGTYGKFWACPVKNADGSWCKYRPEKSKQG